MDLTAKFRDADWHNCRRIGSYELDVFGVDGQKELQFIVLQSAAVHGVTAFRWIAVADDEKTIVAWGPPFLDEEAAIAQSTKYACLAETMRHAEWHNYELIGSLVVLDEAEKKLPRFVFLQLATAEGLTVYRWITVDEDEETVLACGQPLLDQQAARRHAAEWVCYATVSGVLGLISDCTILRFAEIFDLPESPEFPAAG